MGEALRLWGPRELEGAADSHIRAAGVAASSLVASEGFLAPKDFLTKGQGTVGTTTLQMSKPRLERMDDVLKATQPVGGAAMIYPLLSCPVVAVTGSFLGIPTDTQTHTPHPRGAHSSIHHSFRYSPWHTSDKAGPVEGIRAGMSETGRCALKGGQVHGYQREREGGTLTGLEAGRRWLMLDVREARGVRRKLGGLREEVGLGGGEYGVERRWNPRRVQGGCPEQVHSGAQ